MINYLKKFSLLFLSITSFAQLSEKVFAQPLLFEQQTTINYTLTKSDTVSINIYNRWGQLIKCVLNRSYKTIGNYSENLNLKGIPDEFYALAVKIGDRTYSNVIAKNENYLIKSTKTDYGWSYETDTAFKIYPRPIENELDLATISTKMVKPEILRSSLGCSDVRISDPVGQIMITQRGTISMIAAINETNYKKSDEQFQSFERKNENVLFGKINNTSLFTEYRDQEIMIIYYTKSGEEIESKDYRVYGIIYPSTTKTFKLKIEPPTNASNFKVVINRFYADLGGVKTVSKEQLKSAQSIGDIISGYPVKEYNNTLDYVNVNILAVNQGELKSLENNTIALTSQQKQILAAADSGTTIGFEIKFKYKDPHFDDIGSNRKIKEMAFMVKVSE